MNSLKSPASISTHLTLELSDIDLTRMLEQTCSEFEPSFAEKGPALHSGFFPRSFHANAIPDKLARVFDNLLRNANFYSFPRYRHPCERAAESGIDHPAL